MSASPNLYIPTKRENDESADSEEEEIEHDWQGIQKLKRADEWMYKPCLKSLKFSVISIHALGLTSLIVVYLGANLMVTSEFMSSATV